MNTNLRVATELLRQARNMFYNAEQNAREQLKFILERAGENGVSIGPEDYFDCGYEVIAEIEPREFSPVTFIRYWDGKLEVFVSNYEVCEGGRWRILSGGRWVDYVDANVDTWLVLDLVGANLEWADGYAD